MSKNLIRKKIFTDAEANDLRQTIIKDNSKLLNYLKRYNLERVECSNLTNFSFDSIITADSELRPVKVLLSDNKLNDSHYWVSAKAGTIHWIKIDLKVERLIKCIKIKHFGSVEYNTKEFIIKASHDDKVWEELFHEKDNVSDYNNYEINKIYRYFKLEILNPCQKDYYARIKEFGIYGIKI